MALHVRAKICVRNRLHRAINVNCQEWIETCREAKEAISETKANSWKEVLERDKTCGRLYNASTVRLRQTHQTKQWHAMTVPSSILKQILISLLTNRPRQVTLPCPLKMTTLLESSKKESNSHQQIAAVAKSSWMANSNLPSTKWNKKVLPTQMESHQHS